jgi:uncharacterized protein YndB with AHSA1/START domain
MQKLHFSITINAPNEVVWQTMLDDATYTAWTEPFAKGSHYKGEWKKGSRILFLAPQENALDMGMVSRIKDIRPFEFVSIEHLGTVQDGKEVTSSEEVKEWAGALENYTFKDRGNSTEVLIDTDVGDEHKQMMEEMWPKALLKLKNLAESRQ